MWTRAELKSYAKAKLEYNYWPIVGVTFLVGLIVGITNIEIPVDQLVKLGYISDVDALFFHSLTLQFHWLGLSLVYFCLGHFRWDLPDTISIRKQGLHLLRIYSIRLRIIIGM